jgi:transposase-like protein
LPVSNVSVGGKRLVNRSSAEVQKPSYLRGVGNQAGILGQADSRAGGERQAVRPFCRERGIGEHSFYQWRKRLRQSETVRFALLESRPSGDMTAAIELVLTSGERLRIGNQVNATALRLVLDAVRG